MRSSRIAKNADQNKALRRKHLDSVKCLARALCPGGSGIRAYSLYQHLLGAAILRTLISPSFSSRLLIKSPLRPSLRLEHILGECPVAARSALLLWLAEDAYGTGAAGILGIDMATSNCQLREAIESLIRSVSLQDRVRDRQLRWKSDSPGCAFDVLLTTILTCGTEGADGILTCLERNEYHTSGPIYPAGQSSSYAIIHMNGYSLRMTVDPILGSIRMSAIRATSDLPLEFILKEMSAVQPCLASLALTKVSETGKHSVYHGRLEGIGSSIVGRMARKLTSIGAYPLLHTRDTSQHLDCFHAVHWGQNTILLRETSSPGAVELMVVRSHSSQLEMGLRAFKELYPYQTALSHWESAFQESIEG